ncbi:uncharacterized protein LOC111072395 [Drosophila obscura]|uniref:uncharacterized protein LOC111072395 n=1 Tax=Drosophila obscura TaxID=7282 RepID=UPI001BB2BCB0|nr:uncharacterized protein LOC111072395 [Drosophila obscura]XP_022219932.2 uncharacterized protein LOC111072395 [Drosophila obscura]XP_022219933.2 uncharacterized protein LOC111072395 [Drosophila obscura]XP_022219934.2 uncharacterized protein LOC111072395 [Drosophila obscura]
METKNNPPPVTTSNYHHQRAPRTPESYFNVPESVALLNIVKSERIQSAFQSNRKNHASVWEMVAEVLNRFSARKRTAKQCCNRYENLKKIYTQLKKNPERHVRRNWPYMFLFKEIEEQRGECWGSNGKRLALISKNHNELSYYQRRRQAAELGVLLNKDNLTPHQHSLLQSLSQSHAHSTDSSQSGASKLERFLPNHFVETQLNDVPCSNGNGLTVGLPAGVYDDNPNPLQLHVAGAVAAAAAAAAVAAQKRSNELHLSNGGCVQLPPDEDEDDEPQNAAFKDHHHGLGHGHGHGHSLGHGHGLGHGLHLGHGIGPVHGHGHMDDTAETPDYEKDCNGALNLHHQNNNNNDNNISMKSEPLSEGEFNPDDIQLMQTNYNGTQNYYSPGIDQNILHPDVIVDTDNLSDCSSSTSLKKSKRKLSTSTDGDSTNYELIEYLKRREKRDEELLKRMDAREERFMNLLDRTVIAIEKLAAGRTSVPETQLGTSTISQPIAPSPSAQAPPAATAPAAAAEAATAATTVETAADSSRSSFTATASILHSSDSQTHRADQPRVVSEVVTQPP